MSISSRFFVYILIDRIYNFPVLEGIATNGEELILGS